MGLLFNSPFTENVTPSPGARRLRYMAMSKTAVLACKETVRVILPIL